MNINEWAIEHPNSLADYDFIEAAVAEVDSYIKAIEKMCRNKKTLLYLANNRADFDKARNDWQFLTCGQVVHVVAMWELAIEQKARQLETL